MKKALSYSEWYCWTKRPWEYNARYIEGIDQPETPAMNYGKIVHQAIENPMYEWQPAMLSKGFSRSQIHIARKLIDNVIGGRMENPVESEVKLMADFNDIQLFSIFDGLNREQRILEEMKTTASPDRYTQWSVDFHDQVTFYALVYYQLFHAFFTDVRLLVMDTSKGTVKRYHTVRSRRDILDMADHINRCVGEMRTAGIWEKRLTRKERDALKIQQLPLS
jgi:hypothetical protein